MVKTMLRSFESLKTVATFIARITTMIDNAQNKVGTLAGTLLIYKKAYSGWKWVCQCGSMICCDTHVKQNV